MKSKEITFIMSIVICFIMLNGCGIKKKSKQENNPICNIYNFDDVDISEFGGDGFSIEEYKETLEKNRSLSSNDGYNEAIIVVNGKEISRKEYESQKNVLLLRNDGISNKAVVYSIIKNIVLEFEAERLSIEPEDEDNTINAYVDDIKKSFENGENMEYVYAYMEYKGYTEEDYIKESEKNAYNMCKYNTLYEYANEKGDYENVDEYVKTLIKKSTIEIYDSKLDEECRK